MSNPKAESMQMTPRMAFAIAQGRRKVKSKVTRNVDMSPMRIFKVSSPEI